VRHEFYRAVQPIFQDPYSIYNPFYKIERALELAVRNFKLASSKDEGQSLIEEALQGSTCAPGCDWSLPHQLSGGQCQRVIGVPSISSPKRSSSLTSLSR
jgi:peptide/nickel transport system ATP-binding protein